MERTIEILTCDSVESLPDIQKIVAIPRERALKVIFSPNIENIRTSIGAEWKLNLPGFLVGIHLERPEINISKLISEQEIADNSLFFEQCAKDYRVLATQLISELAGKFNETIDSENAMHTFGKYKRSRQTGIGIMGSWKYRLHGSDCRFENIETGQTIEVYLLTRLEFGALDPYFFVEYIKTTKKYRPLPVEFYEDFWDGDRILEKMLQLGKFERIDPLSLGWEKLVVKDRVI
jgi:hypothetical protein